MLAGGDLDGDEYNVICNEDLFPPQCDPPAEYPPAVVKTLDRPCNINDTADWVAEYINSDILGLVSLELLIRADQQALMCREKGCIELAALASSAVDFVKSGTPVDPRNFPKPLYPRSHKPDWAIGEVGSARSGQLTYESRTAIGKLYRRIDLSDADRLAARQAKREHEAPQYRPPNRSNDPIDDITREMNRMNVMGATADSHPISFILRSLLRKYIDVDSPIPPEITDVATEQFHAYVTELRYICATSTVTNKPLTEEEVLVGTIASKTSQPRKRQSLISQLRLQTDELVKRIRAELSGEGARIEEGYTDDGTAEEDLEDSLLRGWVAWHISTLQGEKFGAKSFGIVALGSVFEYVRKLDEREGLAGGSIYGL